MIGGTYGVVVECEEGVVDVGRADGVALGEVLPRQLLVVDLGERERVRHHAAVSIGPLEGRPEARGREARRALARPVRPGVHLVARTGWMDSWNDSWIHGFMDSIDDRSIDPSTNQRTKVVRSAVVTESKRES